MKNVFDMCTKNNVNTKVDWHEEKKAIFIPLRIGLKKIKLIQALQEKRWRYVLLTAWLCHFGCSR